MGGSEGLVEVLGGRGTWIGLSGSGFFGSLDSVTASKSCVETRLTELMWFESCLTTDLACFNEALASLGEFLPFGCRFWGREG